MGKPFFITVLSRPELLVIVGRDPSAYRNLPEKPGKTAA